MKWIKHTGNERPVSGETLVFIKFPDGRLSQTSHPASYYSWQQELGLNTIFEYALAEDQKVQEEKPQQKTLRDEFAMAALTGLTACTTFNGSPEHFANYSYKYADAMLKARSQ